MRNAKITRMLYQDREMLTWRKTSNVALFPKIITVFQNSITATQNLSQETRTDIGLIQVGSTIPQHPRDLC